MYYFLGIEGQTVPQIRVPPCVCRNLLRILLANLSLLTRTRRENENPVRVACSLQIARPVVVPVPSRVYWRHQHTMGEVVCAWFGKIPVVKRENCKAVLHCVAFCLWEGNVGLTSQYGQPLPSRVRGPFVTPLMGMSLLDLGQFNDWDEKIEWLSMQKYVTINWWEGVVG